MPGRSALEIGGHGEDIAVAHLESCGYKILCRNYRTRRGEIDIVARQGDALVFLEVKSTSKAGGHRGVCAGSRSAACAGTSDGARAGASDGARAGAHAGAGANSGEPWERVGPGKRRRILAAARHYLATMGMTDAPCRFDTAVVEMHEGGAAPTVTIIHDSFGLDRI